MAMALPLPSSRVHRQSGPEAELLHETLIIYNYPQFCQALYDLTPEKLIVVLHSFNSNYFIISTRNRAYLFDLTYFTKDTFEQLIQFIEEPSRVKISQLDIRMQSFKVKAKNTFSLKFVFNKVPRLQAKILKIWKKRNRKIDIYNICEFYNYNFPNLYVDLKTRPFEKKLVSKYVSDQIRMYFFAFQKLCQEFNVNYKTVVNNSLVIDVNIKELIDKKLVKKSYYDNETVCQIPIKYCTTPEEFQQAELELRTAHQIVVDSKSFNSQLEILIIGTIDKMYIFRLTGLYSVNIPQHFIQLKHILQRENVFKLIHSQEEIQAILNILSISTLINSMDISSSMLNSEGEKLKLKFQGIERINIENMIMWGLKDEDIQSAAIKIAFQMISNINVFIGPIYEDISADDSDESIGNLPQIVSSKVIIATNSNSTKTLQMDKKIDSSIKVQVQAKKEENDNNHITFIVENNFKSISEALAELKKHLFVAIIFPNDSNYVVISSRNKAFFFDLLSISAPSLTKVVEFMVDPTRIKISFQSIRMECCEIQNVFELCKIYNTRMMVMGENKYQHVMNQIMSLNKLCEAYGYNFDNNRKQILNVDLNSRPLSENSVRNFISQEMLMYFYLFEKYCQEFFINCKKRIIKNSTHFDVDLKGLFSCQLLSNPSPFNDVEKSPSLSNSNNHTDDNSSNGSFQVLNHVEIRGQSQNQNQGPSAVSVQQNRNLKRKRNRPSAVSKSKFPDKCDNFITHCTVLSRPVRIFYCSSKKDFKKAAVELAGVPYICLDTKSYNRMLKLVIIGTGNNLYIFFVSNCSKKCKRVLDRIVSSTNLKKIIVCNKKDKIVQNLLLFAIDIQLPTRNLFDIGSSTLNFEIKSIASSIQELDKKYPLDGISWNLKELQKNVNMQKLAVQTICFLLENIDLFVPHIGNEIKYESTAEINESSSLSFGSCSSSIVELNNCIVEYINIEESCQNQNQAKANLVEVEKQSPSKFYRKGININFELMNNLDINTSLPIKLIITLDDFENVKSILEKSSILSLDCKLLYDSSVCLIVIGHYSNIFLFDTNLLEESSIQVLKSILENDRIIKIMYKCEKQYNCLLEKFQIKLNTILDIDACFYDSFSRGYSIRELIEDFADMSETKWDKRPINEDLKSAAAEIASLLFLNHNHFYIEVDEDLNEIDSKIKNLNLIDLEEKNVNCPQSQEFEIASSLIPRVKNQKGAEYKPNEFFKYSKEDLLEIGLRFEPPNPLHESIVKNMGLYSMQKNRPIVNRGVTGPHYPAITKKAKKNLNAFLTRFAEKVPSEIPALDFDPQDKISDANIMNEIKILNEYVGRNRNKEVEIDPKIKVSIERLLVWSVNELEEKSKNAVVSNTTQENNATAASIGKVEQSSQTGLTGVVYCQNIHLP